MSGIVNYVLSTPKAFGTYVANCLTKLRSTIGCRTPNMTTYPIFSVTLIKPDFISVPQRAITDSHYEQVKSIESTLNASERELFQLAYEKSELERIYLEKTKIVKRFVLQVLRDKQMMSDLLETEASLRIAESERVRELEKCLMASQEQFAEVASNALAQLQANEVTIADLKCELEQLKCLNASSTSRLKTQKETIKRLKAENEELAEQSYNTRAVLNASSSIIADLEFQLEQERENRQVPSIEVADEEKLAVPWFDWGMDDESDEIIPDEIIPEDIEMIPADEIKTPADEIKTPADEIKTPEKTNLYSYNVRNPVVEQELNGKFIISNISSTDYGRVVGKGGRRLTELQLKYNGLKIFVTEGPTGSVEVNLIGSNPDSRRAAAYDIIEDLPIQVDVNFRGLKLTSAVKRRSYYSYRVTISENGDGSYCLSGKPPNRYHVKNISTMCVGF